MYMFSFLPIPTKIWAIYISDQYKYINQLNAHPIENVIDGYMGGNIIKLTSP